MKQPSRPAGTPKKRSSRDSGTGQFVPVGMSIDGFDMHALVGMVRAIKVLEPVLAGAVLSSASAGQDQDAKAYSYVGFILANMKQAALLELTADPESLREAKKLVEDGKRLGNVPLQEVQRIQKLAGDWMVSPDATPHALIVSAVRDAAALHYAAITQKEPPPEGLH